MFSYKFQINEIKPQKIDICKEILRKKIFIKIYKIFYDNIMRLKKKYGLNIYKLVKYKLNEYVCMWIWTQNLTNDPVIPFNNYFNFKNYIENLNYYLNKNFNNNDFIDLKSNLSKELQKSKKMLETIKCEKIKIKKIIDDNTYILIGTYDNIDYSIKIKINLYKQLKKKYKFFNNNKKNYKKYIYCLCYRYYYIDADNQQLAILPKIKNLFKNIGVDFELFGSAINTFSNYYCSLYYDIERYFGSQGNFFNIKLFSGIYWCNPPYNNDIMTKCSLKIVDCLSNDNIGFLVTIPIWDGETKKLKIGNILLNYNKKKSKELFNDYNIYYNLKDYIDYELLIPQFKIPYYNYKENKYINAVDTYMLFICKNVNDDIRESIHKIFNKIILDYK